MKQLERIIELGALAFVALSVFSVLFWSAQFQFILDDLFLPFGLLHLGVLFLRKKEWRTIIIAFAAIATWGLLSDSIANGGVRTSSLGMLLRWMKWPVIMATMANIGFPVFNRRNAIHSVILLFLMLSLVNLIMLVNPFGLGEQLHYYYSPKTDVILINYHEFGAFRLTGTMMNPNTNAAIFAFFMVFFLHLDPKRYWKYILLAFIFVFLTQSRTVLLIALLVILVYVIRMNSRKWNLIMIPAGLIGLIGFLFVFRSTNLVSVLNGSAFGSDSWLERIDHYSRFTSGSGLEMILGHGIVLDPIKQVGFHFDSEYLSILFQYGIVGLLCWISIVAFLPVIQKRLEGKQFFAWSLVILIGGIAFTNFAFLNVEVATLIALLFGIWLSIHRTDKVDNHPQEETN